MLLITLNIKVCLLLFHLTFSLSLSKFILQFQNVNNFTTSFRFYFYPSNPEAVEILADNAIGGADIKSHEALLGNIGTFGAGSMRKSIILSNGTSNAVHDVNSATGIKQNIIHKWIFHTIISYGK